MEPVIEEVVQKPDDDGMDDTAIALPPATDGEDQGFAISEPAPNLEPAPTALVPHTRKKGSRKRTNSGGVGGDKQPEMRPGDWICPDISCSNLNFASRLVCGRFRCRITRPGIDPVIARANPNMMPNNGNNAGGQYEFRSGDWVCPKKTCKNHNFASRDVCRMCHEKKPVRRDGDGGEGRGGGDWMCPRIDCSNHNFRTRNSCRMCRTPRPIEGSDSNAYYGQMAASMGYHPQMYGTMYGNYNAGTAYYGVYAPQAMMAYYPPQFMMYNQYQQQALQQYPVVYDSSGSQPQLSN